MIESPRHNSDLTDLPTASLLKVLPHLHKTHRKIQDETKKEFPGETWNIYVFCIYHL